MRRSLPRITRGRSSAKSPLRRSWPRSDKKSEEEEEALPIYTRLPDRDEVPSARPPRILEAHLHANVDVLPKKPFKLGSDEGRPSGRQVPTGSVTHLPNAYTGHGRQRRDLSPIQTPHSTLRPKPSFRRVDLASSDTYESYLQRGQRASTYRLVGESNRLLRYSFRRLCSTSSSPIASSSNVRIEDMDAMDLQAFADYQTHSQETGISYVDNDNVGFQWQEESTPRLEYTPRPDSQARPRQNKPTESSQRKAKAYSADYIHGARMVEPETRAHMVGILAQAVRTIRSRTLEILQQLSAWHERYPDLRTTASFNILLQFAYDLRHLRAFNQILHYNMPRAGVEKDALTWDMEMESYARHGMWKKVVESWTERRGAGIPLAAKGWTRLAQAATKRGTTSLNTEDIGTSMSPIYSALYDLPKGVRQRQLHKLAMHQKMDVDQMLALMMPDDLNPMDFHATMAVAHRLAKQMRWREAEDVVALYLDRSAETWEAPFAQDQRGDSEGRDTRSANAFSQTYTSSRGAAAAQKEAARRKQNALAFLHVLLECLVISRSSPEMLQAYTENFLIRYENTQVQPEYHTLFFILNAYRVQPLETRFADAYEQFMALESTYCTAQIRHTDKYGLSRCLRQLTTYGLLTLKAYKEDPEKKELCDSTQRALADIEVRSLEVVVKQKEQPPCHGFGKQTWVAKQPRNHLIVKEKYKSLGKPARRKLTRVENASSIARSAAAAPSDKLVK